MYVRLELDNTILKVCADGVIYRYKNNDWKIIEDTENHKKGYNVILINGKQYMRSKIIACAFLNHDLYDNSVFIYHKDNNKMNNNTDNLYIKPKHYAFNSSLNASEVLSPS
jgi:hypothetical protein